MNDQANKNSSDDLSKLLQEWRTDATLPPGFQAAVWRRIDSHGSGRRERESVIQLAIAWFNQLVSRPQLAAAYIALLVMVGVTAGWTQGRREVARAHDDLALRYVQTLDPYQTPKR